MPRVSRDQTKKPRSPQTKRRRPPPSPLLKAARKAIGVTLVLGVVIGGMTWLVLDGHVARWSAELRQGTMDATVAAGFGVEEVLVQGRTQTPPESVLAALAVDRADPILLFSPMAAQAALEDIAWVEQAVVQRRLPDTILVTLTEREPLALWQHEQKLQLIDRRGIVLTDRGLTAWTSLPLVVGPDAPAHAPELLELLGQEPILADRLRAASRVGGRRWDLHLHNEIVINLPETGIATALAHLVEEERAHGLFSRDILSIDLRLPDRLLIQTTPLATERRLLPEEPT